MIKKEYPLTQAFDKIVVADYGKLILTQGAQPSLMIEGEEERLANLRVEIFDNTLTLGVQKDWVNQFGKFIASLLEERHQKVIYYLTVPDLKKIALSGNIELTCPAFTANELKFIISGLGDVNCTQLECDELDIKISGRGKFAASGRADRQTIVISGSGEVSAKDLAGKFAEVVISGQGNLTINVSESLDIKISGSGKVYYRGRPRLKQVINGFGKSIRLNDA